MKRLAVIFLIILAGAGIMTLILALTADQGNNDKLFVYSFRRANTTFSVPVPEKFSFADGAVPVELYYVHNAFERELTINTYWHTNTLMTMKRANRWFHAIDPILKANNIPADFRYLPVIESNLTNAVSPAGAAGFWQLMEKTAIELGLEVNDEVDERFHLEKATEAASRYLNTAYERFGCWLLAAAAYNAGKERIERSLINQKTNCYFNLHLNEETARFVYRLLAVKAIFENPEKYGYNLRKRDLHQPVPYTEVTVSGSIENLIDFALEHGVNYRLFKEFNPWLRSDKLTNHRNNTYVIKIPDITKLNHNELLKIAPEPRLPVIQHLPLEENEPR
ncbi:MAG TPA: lytic transglycosylase domain-containing protein [Bacteroidales bacterium]|nr:lytic transglycosylase domain-containing protein [Bacteroidales bacterium]